MTVLELGGCAPQPLAFYLKALGILRLVSEQLDPTARGWWRGEQFFLASTLDEAGLRKFFLEDYCPSALMSPWNKGAGFFKTNDPALMPLERSTAARFQPFRDGILAAREPLTKLAAADTAVREMKDRTKSKKGMSSAQANQARALKDNPNYKKELAAKERVFGDIKGSVIPQCRLAWRGVHREWLDAALVLDGDGKAMFPSLLGTGGNDGRLDFTNNFMQRLGDLFNLSSGNGVAKEPAVALLQTALFGAAGKGLSQGSAIGQYLPGGAGGANSTMGPSGDSLVNPWDFVLMLEGAMLFKAHAVKRFGTEDPIKASAPFSVSARPAGYGSAGKLDDAARGEQWMPLWNQPMVLEEFKHLLAEGRAKLQRGPVREPLEMARSIARLGIARGISAFERYGYIERNGQSNLTVPLGRFRVPERSLPHLELLDDLDGNNGWLHRLRREARGKNPSTRFQNAEKNLADALFTVTQHPDHAVHWQAVLIALAEIEDVMASGSGFSAGPIPPLQPGWVAASNDDSAEFRLALALGLATFEQKSGGQFQRDPVRRHAVPYDEKTRRFKSASEGGKARLLRGPELVMAGRNPVSDCIALVTRRLVESAQAGTRRLPLEPELMTGAHPADLAALIAGDVDLNRTVQLARAFMALDKRAWKLKPFVTPPPCDKNAYPDDGWIAIRLALLPWALNKESDIGADPAIVRRLESNDATTAVELAVRRLRAKNVPIPFDTASASPNMSRLWAAALAFPISNFTALKLCKHVLPPKESAHA